MAALLGVLPVGSAVVTTEVGDVIRADYIDGGPPGRQYQSQGEPTTQCHVTWMAALGPLQVSRLHLLSHDALIHARDNTGSSDCPYVIPILGPLILL
jgi:hypothetical protein